MPQFGHDDYNIFRWYRAGWGRYTQADFLGLVDGPNLYVYGEGNPLTMTDPLGLFDVKNCGLRTDAIRQAVQDVLNELDRCLGCAPQRERMKNALQNATIRCGGMKTTACAEADSFPSTEIRLSSVVVNGIRRYGNRGRVPMGFPGQQCECLPALITHEAAHNAFDFGRGRDAENFSRRIAGKCFSCAN